MTGGGGEVVDVVPATGVVPNGGNDWTDGGVNWTVGGGGGGVDMVPPPPGGEYKESF